ncbi:MAG: ImmA/IrrE family metallo-endopeptidase [Streptosporangiaceae bacterium]|nr:ImmA/IrrE family metallo-endopeptidase [Streptosporangiaceae bacterium]MBV9853509.1 ImmA/IrrE family metallo-endopeptidase [Streptosporangiaceae bacterium]
MADAAFKIAWEWEAAPSVRAAEHRATWARMEIRIGDEWATLVEDRDSGSARHSLYCPLYPLAEWIAYNWWFLQSDARPSGVLARLTDIGAGDVRNLPREQRDRHSIRASGDGFAWPDLWIVPDGNSTRLVWQGDLAAAPDWPIRFLSSGERRVDSEEIQLELGRLVSAVLTRLAEQGVTGTALEKEWAEIREMDADEAEYAKAAARLGLDPYSMPEEYESTILRAADSLPAQVFGDFLDAADPALMRESLDWILRIRADGERAVPKRAKHKNTVPFEGLARMEQAYGNLTDAVRQTRGELDVQVKGRRRLPWQLGRMQALHARSFVEASLLAKFDVQGYVSSATSSVSDRALHALGRTDQRGKPVAVLGRRSRATAARFTLARCLWHFIWDDDPYFLVTSAYTDRQKIERAFAAELLAPAEGIAELLPGEPQEASQEELDEVAQHYGVSSMVVSHQVRNQLMVVS